jgi:hypothetical protein
MPTMNSLSPMQIGDARASVWAKEIRIRATMVI